MAAARQGHRACADAQRGDLRMQPILQARLAARERGRQSRAYRLDPSGSGGEARGGGGNTRGGGGGARGGGGGGGQLAARRRWRRRRTSQAPPVAQRPHSPPIDANASSPADP